MKRILHITSARVDLYRVARHGVDLEAGFPNDASGLGALAAHFWNARRPGTLRVVADLAEEDFHVESIPLLRGADRRGILSRRLRQRFPDESTTMTASLGRFRAERREERVLFGAFTQPQQVQPVLALVRRERVTVDGFYSVAQLAPAVLARAGIVSSRALLVSAGHAGLRHTYVEDGRLRFSRLSALARHGLDPRFDAIRGRETERTHQYLLSSGLVDAGTTVVVADVAPDAARGTPQESTGDSRLEWRSVAFETAARAIGLHHWPPGHECEALAAYVAATSAPRESYADGTLRAELRRRRWGIAVTQVASMVAGLSFSAAIATTLATKNLREQIDRIRGQATVAAAEHEAVTARLPSIPTVVESLRATARIEMELRRHREPVDGFLRVIGRSLNSVPEIELDSLRWQRDAALAAASAAGADTGVETAEIVGRIRRARQGTSLQAAEAERLFEGFVHGLTRQPGIALVEARLPFGASTKDRISGDLGGAFGPGSETFTVVVRRDAI